jgi:peroxiredoxin
MKKLLIAISSILIALPSLAINNSLKSQNGLNIGDKIPHFDLRTEKDILIKFNENYKDKVLLLVFCNYCNKDLAGSWTISSFYKFYKNKDFRYVVVFSRRCVPFYVPDAFISYSASQTARQVRVPYFLMHWDEKVSENYKVNLDDPHIYVVNKRGIIIFKQTLITPFVSTEPMNEAIENALKE